MNIFALDWEPKQAAKWHCDAHIIKMPLETAQMLSTVNHLSGNGALLYAPTHVNHPCNIWARISKENYQWLWEFGLALCDEYEQRYKKIHASKTILYLTKNIPKIIKEKN